MDTSWTHLLLQDIKEWCKGRSWLIRLPLLIYCLYVLVRYLADPGYHSYLGWLNFGLHELGHFLFRPLGNFMRIAGGTLFQCFVPFLAMWTFHRQRDYFAIAISFGWLSTNLFGVARYVADARAMVLPLTVPGVGTYLSGSPEIHDWNRILRRIGMLEHDLTIAFFIRCAGTVAMAICLFAGIWLLWQMFRSEKVDPDRW